MSLISCFLPVLCLITVFSVPGCAAPQDRRALLQESDYPWELLPAEAFGRAGSWRQKVTASFDGSEESFQAVLQAAAGELLVVGISPMGTRVFALRQRGLTVEFEEFLDGEVPFPGRFILVDIQRCLFQLAPPPADGEGTRNLIHGDEEVTETWKDGLLVERHFHRREEGAEATLVHVRYKGGFDADGVCDHMVLRNKRFDYRLSIRTSRE